MRPHTPFLLAAAASLGFQVQATVIPAVHGTTRLDGVHAPRPVKVTRFWHDSDSTEYIPTSAYFHKRDDARDVRYLNLALTLEYLQEALYQHGLSKYTEDDFKKVNLPDWGRQRFAQIASHEQMHVQFLQSAISVSGSEHVKPCEYIFNDNDPKSFIAMTEAVESIATSAYTGLAQYIDSKSYLSAMSSLLATEARHASWIYASLFRGNPWNTAFETELTPSQAHSIASTFIKPESCPDTNTSLLPEGLFHFPPLSLPSRIFPGQSTELIFDHSHVDGNLHLYAAFTAGATFLLSPLTIVNQGAESKMSVTVPRDLREQGGVYVSVVQGGEQMGDVRVDDAGMVAGPALVMFAFNAQGNPVDM